MKTKKRAPKCLLWDVFVSRNSEKKVKRSGTVVSLNDSGLIVFSRFIRNDAVFRFFLSTDKKRKNFCLLQVMSATADPVRTRYLTKNSGAIMDLATGRVSCLHQHHALIRMP